MSSAASGPRWFSSSARIWGQRLPQLPLFAIGLTMTLVFTASPQRRRSRQLDAGGASKQPESEVFTDAQIDGNIEQAGLRKVQAFQEKNAIFSTWLMRRIGARGSLAGLAGLLSMPLARMLEPSDISTTGGTTAGGSSGL